MGALVVGGAAVVGADVIGAAIVGAALGGVVLAAVACSVGLFGPEACWSPANTVDGLAWPASPDPHAVVPLVRPATGVSSRLAQQVRELSSLWLRHGWYATIARPARRCAGNGV